MSSRSRLAAILSIVAIALAACGGGSSPTPVPVSPGLPTDVPSAMPSAIPTVAPTPTPPPVALTIGLGYIPSVQFAPFYLADQAGYYRDAGLDVTFRHGTDYDVIALVGQGALDLGLADGTSVIPAVSQGIPLKYVATIYGKFPSIVFAKTSAGIASAADLKGRKLGIPGKYGSSWIMLQALLGSAKLTPDDLVISEYPDYGQGAAVAAGAVDAATGFANNEPVQLGLTGEPVTVLRIDDITPLPGNGLIVADATLAAKHDAVAAFVAATLRAMEEITARPEVGLEAAITAVPDLATARETQAAILDATIGVWTGTVQAERGLGAIDPAGWDASIAYLTTLGLVPNRVTSDQMVDTTLLPARD